MKFKVSANPYASVTLTVTSTGPTFVCLGVHVITPDNESIFGIEGIIL